MNFICVTLSRRNEYRCMILRGGKSLLDGLQSTVFPSDGLISILYFTIPHLEASSYHHNLTNRTSCTSFIELSLPNTG